MLLNLKSNAIFKKIFGLLENTLCLKIISYNKSFQSELDKNIEDFKKASKIYLIFEDKEKVKEYDKESNILVFEGEYKNKKRNGFGKEYCKGKLIFEGQYKDGLKNGPGKAYDDNGKLIFEGIYLNGAEWEGQGQIVNTSSEEEKVIYYGKITEGKINGYGRKVDLKSVTEYEGNFIKGKKWGHGKELRFSKLVYEGEFKDDKRSGYGKEYDHHENIIFEGQFLDGKRWEGFGKEIKNYDIVFEGEYKKGKRNGKGKEYYFDKLGTKFIGNYLDGERSGKGIEYFENGKIKFTGDFFKGGYNNGKGYNINREEIFEIKNGEGNIKIYNNENKIEFEGEYKNYRYWNGKISSYEYGNLIYELFYLEGVIIRLKKYNRVLGYLEFEGEIINGELKKGKEYKDGELLFEGEYHFNSKIENSEQFISEYLGYSSSEFSNQRWNGKGKDYNFSFKDIKDETYIYEGDYLEGKKTGFGKIYVKKEVLVYEGELLDGKLHGKGKLFDEEGNLKIEGDFIDDKADYKNGFIKEYENGKLSTETKYSGGIPLRAKHYNKEGIIILEYKDKWIKEYYDNGNLKAEGEYYAGYIGIIKEYYENGKILFEGEAKDNVWWNGKVYNENGEIIDEIKDGKSLNNKDKVEEENEEERKKDEEKNVFEGEYYDGEYWTGKLKEYYDNGNIKLEVVYLNGEKNGNCKSYDEDGIIKSEKEYINGKKIGKCKYYKKGILYKEREALIFGQMLKIKEYYDNGAIRYEGEGNFEGNSVGKGKLFSKKGELLFEGEFGYGYLNGKGKKYYYLNEDNTNNNDKDLILEYEGEFYNRKKEGKGKQYSEDGKTIFEGIFSNDKPFEGKEITYDENGKITGEKNIKYGYSHGLAWMKKNSCVFEGEYINDSYWNGKYKSFNEKGDIIVNGEFKNGYFNGIVRIKNEKGEFIEEKYKNGKIWTGHTKVDSNTDRFLFDETDTKHFRGEYLEGKRWKGKGKELYPNKITEFEGEYDKGERIKGIEYYEDGIIKYEGDYLNGKYYNGKAYNTTGEEMYEIKEGKGLPKDFEKYGYRYEGEYLNGLKNGKGKEYYKEKLIFEGKYLNGLKSEHGKEYHFIDGYLLFEGEYLKGERIKGKEYYDNGKIKFEGEYFDGKINKKGKEYNKEGELIREGEFEDNKLWTGKKYPTKYDKNEEEYLYGKKHGKVKEYYVDHFGNILKFEGEYYCGNKLKGKIYEGGEVMFDGEFMGSEYFRFFRKYDSYEYKGKKYKEGKLIFEGKMDKENCLTGKKYRNGSEIEGEYLNGKKYGKWKEYDNEGNLEFEGEINEFMKYRKGKWLNNGRLEFEGEYYDNKEWKGKKKKYDDNSTELEAEYEYSLGKKNGKAIEYYNGGKIRFEGEYLNDRKWNGKGYNPNGELIYEIKNGKGDIKEYDFNGNEN